MDTEKEIKDLWSGFLAISPLDGSALTNTRQDVPLKHS